MATQIPVIIDDTLLTEFDSSTDDLDGAGGGGATIGDAVSGGTANRVLYVDSSGNLANHANFQYDGATKWRFGSVTDLRVPNTTSIFWGYKSGEDYTSSAGTVAIGYNAAKEITSGGNNVLIGREAGSKLTTGAGNTFLGTYAGKVATGGNNVALGSNSLLALTTGTFNFAAGNNALDSLTTGSYNWAGGYAAGQANSTGSRNFYGGWRAGYSHTGDDSIFIGSRAGEAGTASDHDVLYIHSSAGTSNETSALIHGNFSQSWLRINDKLGVGISNPTSNIETDGDIEVTGSANGLILESPDNTRWRITVSNAGIVSAASV